MNRHARHKPTPAPRLTPFERETKRRRSEMLRNLSGRSHSSVIPMKRMKVLINEGPRELWVRVMKSGERQAPKAQAT